MNKTVVVEEELIKYVPVVVPVRSGPMFKQTCSRWTDPYFQNNPALEEKEMIKADK